MVGEVFASEGARIISIGTAEGIRVGSDFDDIMCVEEIDTAKGSAEGGSKNLVSKLRAIVYLSTRRKNEIDKMMMDGAECSRSSRLQQYWLTRLEQQNKKSSQRGKVTRSLARGSNS